MAEQRRGSNPKDSDNSDYAQDKEVLISVNRVTRVVKGGRRFRMQALVVVGNGDDVASAASKAGKIARKNMQKIKLNPDNQSISHEVKSKVSGAQILLMPASLGTGLIAGGTVRSVLSVTGVKNILSKSLGSSNKINCAYATIEALTQLVPKEEWVGYEAKKTIKVTE